MATQWDSWLENQQKAMNWWKDMAQQMQQTNASKPSDTAAAFPGLDTVQNWWKQWTEQQQRVMEEMMKSGAAGQMWEKSPDWMQQWTHWQQDMAKMWSKAAPEVTPFPWTQFAAGSQPNPFASFGDMSKWLQESNRWISENMMRKLPENMRPHLGSFMDAYGQMYKYWEPIQKMITLNMTSNDQVFQHVGMDAYREWIGKFFGMKMPMEQTHLLETTKDMFDRYIKWLSEFNAEPMALREQWAESFARMRAQGISPAFQAVMDMSNLVNEGLERIYHIATPSRELEMAQVMKNLQFNYLAFLTRSSELQTMVYEASQFALPEAIRHFYQKYMDKREMPDYQEFFKHYLDILEEHVLEVLNSQTYSTLQAEVAKLGVLSKSNIDELTELAFSNQPFLMRSFADETAQELTSLRRKVRTLEHSLSQLETRLGEQAASDQPATIKRKTAKTV